MMQSYGSSLAADYGTAAAYAAESERAAFVSRVYRLLFLTMAAAAGATVFSTTPLLAPFSAWLVAHPILAMIIYFGWAFGMNAIAKMPTVGPLGLVGFGVFTGLWIAPMVLAYAAAQPETVTSALVATAGIFGSMSVLGATTKKDLSGLGAFLMPGLIVVILLSLLNLFLFQSSLMSTAVSAVTVLLFTGFIARDTQNVMRNYPTDMAVSAAMALYLNVFILFINLLQLLRRD